MFISFQFWPLFRCRSKVTKILKDDGNYYLYITGLNIFKMLNTFKKCSPSYSKNCLIWICLMARDKVMTRCAQPLLNTPDHKSRKMIGLVEQCVNDRVELKILLFGPLSDLNRLLDFC